MPLKWLPEFHSQREWLIVTRILTKSGLKRTSADEEASFTFTLREAGKHEKNYDAIPGKAFGDETSINTFYEMLEVS